MDWLSKIDPNTIIGLGGLLFTLATWTYHKLRGDKVDSFTDTIRGLGKQAIHTLLMDPTVTLALDRDALTGRATALLFSLAKSIDVPQNAITAAIITATAQHVVGDVLDELRAADSLQGRVDALAAQVAAIPASIAEAEARGLAAGRAFARDMVEVVPTEPQAVPIVPPKGPA